MIKRPKGIRRIRRPEGMEHDAVTDDDGVENRIEESVYRARGYEPAWELLPWADA